MKPETSDAVDQYIATLTLIVTTLAERAKLPTLVITNLQADAHELKQQLLNEIDHE